MGYLPGMLWILAGVVFAGAVQDFVVLFISTRRDGRSWATWSRSWARARRDRAVRHLHDHGHHPRGAGADRGEGPGRIAVGHVHRGRHHPHRDPRWASTCRYIRPGHIGEMSLIGFVLLMASIIYGGDIAASRVGPGVHLRRQATHLDAIGYGFIASVLPVWLLLAPRDYLSTFLQDRHHRRPRDRHRHHAPAADAGPHPFIDGTGPVWSGSLFPSCSSPSPAARVRFPCADLLGHHAQAAGPTRSTPASSATAAC